MTTAWCLQEELYRLTGIASPFPANKAPEVKTRSYDGFPIISSPPPPCSYLAVVPDPDAPSGQIEVANCHSPWPDIIQGNTGGPMYFDILKGGGQCDEWCLVAVDVEPSTWGAVKALYSSD